MVYKIIDLTESEKEVEVTLPYNEIKNDVEKEVLKQIKKSDSIVKNFIRLLLFF